tara:strand:- start:179 stop:574 length:396 start_codon:yes stop_codon:yes gene_type:complete
MNDIEFYIDTAKEAYRANSDRKLSVALGLNAGAVGFWRRGVALPNDNTMVRLADLAGVSKEQALLELSYWRSEGEAKETYGEILKKVSLGATVSAFAMILPDTAYAADTALPAAASSSITLSAAVGLYILW